MSTSKEQKIQINNLLWHLQELEKHLNPKLSKAKCYYRSKQKQVKYRLDIQKINEAESWFLQEYNQNNCVFS